MKHLDGIYKSPPKRTDGIYAPVKLCDLTFEQILEKTMSEIKYLARRADGFIESFEQDDIVQELSIKLWQLVDRQKLPKDMVYLDFRYLRFVDQCFKRRILDLKKLRYERSLRAERVLRDLLDNSVPLPVGFENFIAKD